MKIGVAKEIMLNERRVAATPESVQRYTKMGYEVLVESGAGGGIFAEDEQYRKAGAQIVPTATELFGSVDLVLKVKQPGFNSFHQQHEIDMMREGTALVTFIHPASPGSHENVRHLARRRITSFTMDSIPRISRAQTMDALTSMSTVTGYKAVLNAAARLPIFVPMVGTAIGVIKPARFLIIGCGVVGLQAVATAKRLGAIMNCLDIRPEAAESGQSLGAKVAPFAVPDEIARGEGGYARALPPDWIEKERVFIKPLVEEADVVILSALVPGEMAPILVTREMVARMRPGSVIVDVSIDQGGNCEATVPGEEVTVNQVVVSGIQNIPGSVPVHSTFLYANNMVNFMANLCKAGPGRIDWDDEIVRHTLVTRDGKIHHEGTLRAMESTR